MSIQRIKANLDMPAFRAEILRRDILSWAMYPDGGGLPGRSAGAFADWLDETWNNWTDDEEMTVEQVLQGAVTHWCGGRTL